MPRYIVELRLNVESFAQVEIEAESAEKAKDKAYHKWEQDCDDNQFEWDVLEENCQVHDCEELDATP